jgi:hypothetical protein
MSLSFMMFIAFSLSIHTTKKLCVDRQPDNKSTDSGPPTRLPVLDQRRGDVDEALICHQKALALTEAHGESVYRMYALWSIGVAKWRHGERAEASQLLKHGLQLAHVINDPRIAASCLEALAWIANDENNPRRAVVMMGAADALGRAVGSATVAFPNLMVHHEECEHRAREALDDQGFHAALEQGRSLTFGGAVTYALEGATSLTAQAETSARDS